MKPFATIFSVAMFSALIGTSAYAQALVKIGVILPYSGPFAEVATQMDNAIKLFVSKNGDTVAGKKIEIIRRDTGGVAPDNARRLAQELVIRDKVDILTGLAISPNALAVADISKKAEKFTVVMQAGASLLTNDSPYIVRTSLTTGQLNEALAQWAIKDGGLRKVFTMASDYGPGAESERIFSENFRAGGGTIIGSVLMPIATTDFSPFVQRAKDSAPEGIFAFVPAGPQPAALGKALFERGIDLQKTKIFGPGEITEENALKSMGDIAIGLVTAFHYDYNHKSPENDAFVAAYTAEYKRNPNFLSVGAWDGMQLIYDALKRTNGETSATALTRAASGMSWVSPRGKITIDPETRDIIQTIYIRKVEKIDGKLVNVEIGAVSDVKDPVKARMKK
jgi:branched-chain amino acid transport system substrate-binding protein